MYHTQRGCIVYPIKTYEYMIEKEFTVHRLLSILSTLLKLKIFLTFLLTINFEHIFIQIHIVKFASKKL